MGALDWLTEIIQNLFSVNGDGWVQRKSVSSLNIENCNGKATGDENTKTCALCVALNDTIFRNNNKPNYYHMHCKCKNISATLTNAILDFPIEKITRYLFLNVNKAAMMKSMGYTIEDAEEVYNNISNNAKIKFINGDYSLGNLSQHGQIVNIEMLLNGKGLKNKTTYKFITGWTAYPNGKLHNNTPFGGWVK